MLIENPVQDQSHLRIRLLLLQHQHNYVFNSTNIKLKKKKKISLPQCPADSQVIKQFKLKLNQTQMLKGNKKLTYSLQPSPFIPV